MQGTLQEIINQYSDLPWDQDLYVSNKNLTLVTSVRIVEDDEGEVVEGFEYYLTVQNLQSVIENLLNQTSNPSSKEILEAILYYHENDAFICLNRK